MKERGIRNEKYRRGFIGKEWIMNIKNFTPLECNSARIRHYSKETEWCHSKEEER